MAVAACGDDATAPDEQADENVDGLWMGTYTDALTAQTLTLYLRVSASEIEVTEGRPESCFNVSRLEVVSRNGSTFTVRAEGASSNSTVRLTLDGDRLRATGVGSAEVLMDPSSDNLSGLPACALDGAWAGLNNDDWVEIVGTRYTVWLPVNSCYQILRFDMESRGGTSYDLNEQFSGAFIRVDVENRAGVLVVSFADGGQLTYEPAPSDPADLGVCGSRGDPETPCQDLPALTLGEPVTGALESTDSVDPDYGGYYDVYGLTLTEETEVTVDLESEEFDTYLRLWDTDGGYIAENDDASSNTFNSSLTLTLAPACYRVEASSFFSEETGAYTLTAR